MEHQMVHEHPVAAHPGGNRGSRRRRTSGNAAEGQNQDQKRRENDKRDSQTPTPTPGSGTHRTPPPRTGRPRDAAQGQKGRGVLSLRQPGHGRTSREGPAPAQGRAHSGNREGRPGRTGGARAAGGSSSSRPRCGSWQRRASTPRRRWGARRHSYPSRR